MTSCAAADGYHLARAHGRLTINPTPAPESRCVRCGYPCRDHLPFRYWIRPYLMHLLPARVARWLKPLRRR